VLLEPLDADGRRALSNFQGEAAGKWQGIGCSLAEMVGFTTRIKPA